jgi:hypothetical protein
MTDAPPDATSTASPLVHLAFECQRHGQLLLAAYHPLDDGTEAHYCQIDSPKEFGPRFDGESIDEAAALALAALHPDSPAPPSPRGPSPLDRLVAECQRRRRWVHICYVVLTNGTETMFCSVGNPQPQPYGKGFNGETLEDAAVRALEHLEG